MSSDMRGINNSANSKYECFTRDYQSSGTAVVWNEIFMRKYVLCIGTFACLSVDSVALAGLFQRWRPVEDSTAELFIADQRSVHTDQPCSDSADPQRRLFWDQSRSRQPGFTQHCREWVTCSYAVNIFHWYDV